MSEDSKPLTDDQLAELTELIALTTGGSWHVYGNDIVAMLDDGTILNVFGEPGIVYEDGQFVQAAKKYMVALVTELKERRAKDPT